MSKTIYGLGLLLALTSALLLSSASTSAQRSSRESGKQQSSSPAMTAAIATDPSPSPTASPTPSPSPTPTQCQETSVQNVFYGQNALTVNMGTDSSGNQTFNISTTITEYDQAALVWNLNFT